MRGSGEGRKAAGGADFTRAACGCPSKRARGNRTEDVMSERETLLALAARCEAATGADGILDADIMAVLHPELSGAGWERVTHPNGKWAFFADRDRDSGNVVSPHRYTASLDAAMTLACDEWDSMDLFRDAGEWFCVVKAQGKGGVYREMARVHHATPALALCAAAMRARAAEGLA